MFQRILVANRGEIAVRILRTCREMGIETVAVCSTADQNALHAQLGGRSICIGGPAPAQSYLNIKSILTAALGTGCQAIHPGFGFLSENSEFARLCGECGLKFIGPTPEVIDAMGNKAAAREKMRACGVPVVPGSEGNVASVQEALRVAQEIGYPVLVKAAAGGGGRGMRLAHCPQELPQAFETARAEAKACFDNDEMYLEKWILHPKHIEFQILGDEQGSVIHLGERDCSIQRKNQKMIEESPARVLSPALREAMGQAAVKAAKAVHYTGAGTVEFVLDRDGHYYFIEMNTRIQVEHGVTELRCGLDLIRQQLRVAAGLPLELKQEEVILRGHAIECRINAEDPTRDFAPSPGKIGFLHFPGGCGIRVDSAAYPGCEIPPYYDSMIGKMIAYAPTRLEAIRKLRRALAETVIEGVKTNVDFGHLVLFHPAFLQGNYDTGFMTEHLQELLALSETCGREDQV